MHELRDPLPLPATVLVVGSEDDAHDIEAALEYPGSKVVRGSSGAHARRILRSERVRLLVTDLFLRDGDARDLLAWMRARPATATIPAIVVARAATPEIRDACVLLGAERVVEKPVLAEELSTAATEAVEKSERCANAARKDPVTDLPNRAAFLERFERAAAFAARP